MVNKECFCVFSIFRDTFFRTSFAELYEERSKVDEEGSRQYKEMQIERIKKQVIEEKLKEKRDWYNCCSSACSSIVVSCARIWMNKICECNRVLMMLEPSEDAALKLFVEGIVIERTIKLCRLCMYCVELFVYGVSVDVLFEYIVWLKTYTYVHKSFMITGYV